MPRFGSVCTECHGLGQTSLKDPSDTGNLRNQITLVVTKTVCLRMLYMNGMMMIVQPTTLSSVIEVIFNDTKEIILHFYFYFTLCIFLFWNCMFHILFSFKTADHCVDQNSDWCWHNKSSYWHSDSPAGKALFIFFFKEEKETRLKRIVQQILYMSFVLPQLGAVLTTQRWTDFTLKWKINSRQEKELIEPQCNLNF